ncbi:hypothetical protein Tco_0464579 [Tanacetum coccineum]
MQKIWHSCANIQEALQTPTNNNIELLQTPGTRLKIPHQAEQVDWLETRIREFDEQRLESTLQLMDRIQEVSLEESVLLVPAIRTGKQNDFKAIKESKRIIDSRIGKNKQNEFEKYKAFNDRTIDYEILQTKLNETLGLLALKDIEIKEGLKTKAYEISVLNQKHDELVKKSLLTKSQLEGYLKEEQKVISDLKHLNARQYNGRPTFANPRYLKKAQSEKPCLYEIPFDTSDPANRFAPDREETMTLENKSRSKLNKDKVKPYDYTNQNSLMNFKGPYTGVSLSVGEPQKKLGRSMGRMNRMYRIATTTTQNREPQLPHASRNTNPHVSKSSGVNHTTSVSRPQLKCYQVKDKVVPNNSQVKFKKKEVEDHHKISSISKKTNSVTACNDSSNSRTSNVNAVCAECGKCVFNSNHDACVSRYLNDVNARTKKPNVVPISASNTQDKTNRICCKHLS